MPTDEELADLRERVERLEHLTRLVLEIVPDEWILAELRDRMHGGDRHQPDE